MKKLRWLRVCELWYFVLALYDRREPSKVNEFPNDVKVHLSVIFTILNNLEMPPSYRAKSISTHGDAVCAIQMSMGLSGYVSRHSEHGTITVSNVRVQLVETFKGRKPGAGRCGDFVWGEKILCFAMIFIANEATCWCSLALSLIFVSSLVQEEIFFLHIRKGESAKISLHINHRRHRHLEE
jgi:hypothetical protein